MKTMLHNPPRRGSILLLVVVVLTLSVLLGAVYIQIAQLDRLSTSQSETDNIDLVVQASLNEIMTTLEDDLADAQGELFNTSPADSTEPGDEGYDYPHMNEDTGSARNQWAYTKIDGSEGTTPGGHLDDAWLASAVPTFSAGDPVWDHVTIMNPTVLRVPLDGRVSPDDEMVIDNSDTTPTYGESTLNSTNLEFSTDDPRALDDGPTADFRDLGTDADGDGVFDAYWTWAPIKQIGDVAYIAAYRIVDLSSMIDLNTSSALRDGSLNRTALGNGTGARGYLPTDSDLTRLFERTGEGAWQSELDNLITARGLTAGLPVPLGLTSVDGSTSADSRYGLYWESMRYYGQEQVDKLGFGPNLVSEIALRLNGGVVDSDFSETQLTNNAQNVFRTTATTETDYSSVAGLSAGNELEHYFIGYDGNATNGPVDNRTYPAIRHMTTFHSGSALVAPSYNTFVDRQPRYDLVFGNFDHGTGTYDKAARRNNIRHRIHDILLIGDQDYQPGSAGNQLDNDGESGSIYLNDAFKQEYAARTGGGSIGNDWRAWSDQAQASGGREGLLWQAATEFALNIIDYADVDARVSGNQFSSQRGISNTNNITYYGLEVMPFIREVYVQGVWDDQDLMFWDVTQMVTYQSGDPKDNKTDTWVYQTGSEATAIEIANPFDRPLYISLDGDPDIDEIALRLAIDDDGDGTTDTQIPLTTANFSFTNAAGGGETTRLQIASRGRLILYVNPADPNDSFGEPFSSHLESGGKGADLPNDIGFDSDLGDGAAALAQFNGSPDQLAFPIPTDASGVTPVVHLQIDTDPDGATDWVTYDRFHFDASVANLATIQHATTDAEQRAEADRIHAHTQLSVARDGRGFRFLSNIGKDTVGTRSPLPAMPNNYRTQLSATPTPVSQLTLHTKARNGQAGDEIEGDTNLDIQIPIANRPIHSVSELGWIFMIGFYESGETLVPGDIPSRLGQDDGDIAIDPRRFFLQFDEIAQHNKLPHAAMILDQFTVNGPMNDNVDNDDPADNTGVDDTGELFRMGLANINTMPLHLAAMRSAVPEDDSNVEAMFQQIMEYRDDPTARSGLLSPNVALTSGEIRGGKGIHSLAEIMNLAEVRLWADTSGFETSGDSDLYPMPENVGVDRTLEPDNGAEERMTRFQFLSETFSTRSDRFVAYVKIQGLASSDFSIVRESAHYLAVFDRTPVMAGGSVRVIAFYRID